MNFEWAIKQMMKGNKVRRSFWDKKARYYLANEMANQHPLKWKSSENNEYDAYFDVEDFEADDWELYKEKKETLSDKINGSPFLFESYIDTFEVKKAIKKLQEEWLKFEYYPYPVDNSEEHIKGILRKTFGDKLI